MQIQEDNNSYIRTRKITVIFQRQFLHCYDSPRMAKNQNILKDNTCMTTSQKPSNLNFVSAHLQSKTLPQKNEVFSLQ